MKTSTFQNGLRTLGREIQSFHIVPIVNLENEISVQGYRMFIQAQILTSKLSKKYDLHICIKIYVPNVQSLPGNSKFRKKSNGVMDLLLTRLSDL